MVKINLTDEDLATRGTSNYFSIGEHEVLIQKAERGTTADGKDYVEFTVLGQDDESDTARLWFTTEKASIYAMSIMSGIAVHNRKTDAEKKTARDAIKAIKDTDLVDAKFLAKFVNMDAFYSVYQSTRTYTGKDGSQKFSYDKNIYGYAPNPRKTTAADLINDFKANGEAVNVAEIPFE